MRAHSGLARFKLRSLMIAVAIIAVAIALESTRERRAACFAVLQSYANNEAAFLADRADPSRGADRSIASRYLKHGKQMGAEEALAEIARMRPRYEYVISHPWMPLPSDD